MSIITAKDYEKEKVSYEREREQFLQQADKSQKQLQAEKDKLFQQQIQLQVKNIAFLEQVHKDEQLEAKRQENWKDNIVTINVGGTIYTTLKVTLTRFENSLLADLFNEKIPASYDSEGNLFIDRDSRYFPAVLEYLRTGLLPMSLPSAEDTRLFKEELNYYRIGPKMTSFQIMWNPDLKSEGLTISHDGKSIVVTGNDGDHVAIIGNSKLTKGSVTVTVKTHVPRPNRYSIGCIQELPETFNRGFSYKTGVWGWGLHDHITNKGIFCQNKLVAPSTNGYTSNDLVTMTVDVDKGDLIFKVNGSKCAELLNCEMITHGVYLAVTLFNKGARWKLIT